MRAKKKTITAQRATPARLATMRFADRLNDIVARLEVAGLAVEGAIAASDADVLGPVVTFLDDVRAEISAVSHDIHPAKIAEAGL